MLTQFRPILHILLTSESVCNMPRRLKRRELGRLGKQVRHGTGRKFAVPPCTLKIRFLWGRWVSRESTRFLTVGKRRFMWSPFSLYSVYPSVYCPAAKWEGPALDLAPKYALPVRSVPSPVSTAGTPALRRWDFKCEKILIYNTVRLPSLRRAGSGQIHPFHLTNATLLACDFLEYTK